MKGLRQWLKLLVIGGLIFPSNFVISDENKDVISYTQFLDELEGGKVKEIKIFCQKRIKGKYIDGSKFATNIPYYDINLIKLARENKVTIWCGPELPEKKPWWMKIDLPVMIIVVIVVFLMLLFKILRSKYWRLFKSETLYWEKALDCLNELIKKCDSIIELLKQKQ